MQIVIKRIITLEIFDGAPSKKTIGTVDPFLDLPAFTKASIGTICMGNGKHKFTLMERHLASDFSMMKKMRAWHMISQPNVNTVNLLD